MTALASREALVEEELYHFIRVVLDKHGSKLDGVEFGKVQPQHPVDGGIADLVLPFADGKHLLVIECKRKVGKPSGMQTIRDFDIFGSNVLSQALNYAVRLGSLAFATTNGQRLALFRTPKAGEPFRIDTHRLLVLDPFTLDEKSVEGLLGFLAKWHVGIPVRLVEIDWFFISRLRSFVDFLTKSFLPVVKQLASDEATSKKLEEFSQRVGGVTTEQLARQTAYLLMNKFVFYKILERHYEDLPKLKPISAPDGKYFIEFLRGYFEKAIQVTGDFEPIFITEFYDDIPLPNADYALDEVNSFIEEMDTYRLEEVGSDVVGYIYEELLPDVERHNLGQFYTPPPIAELIVKWAVRSQNDLVLDPAVGSGTFLVKAYQRLMELKTKHPKSIKSIDSGSIHKEILSQLYADDINPFPAQLTSMNLAMRNVQYPTSEMNIIVEDFFNLKSRMQVFAPYVIKTPKGEIKRHVTIPSFDAVVANPPYTRGVEITNKTSKSINTAIGQLLKKYKLSGGIGRETGIYVYFVIHALEFLKENGRLGMIVSNSWLQSDYGINFCDFLLDHFKVKAIIDFNQRLFRIPLVATCVLLLEKERNQQERSKNRTVLLYVSSESKVEDLLDAVENPDGWKEKFQINTVRQSDIPRKDKIIKVVVGADYIEKRIKSSPLIAELGDFLEPRYGNIQGVFGRGGTGGDKFFYLAKQDAEQRGLIPEYVHPALVSSRYSKTLEFSMEDWKKLRKDNKPCYVFMSHKPRHELPTHIKEYIQWGETTPLLRVKEGTTPKTPKLSIASLMREKSKEFFGWYDLGGVMNISAFATYRSQYRHRFCLTALPLAIDKDLIALLPKNELAASHLRALLAFFNSGISQFFVEILGRSTGGGMMELDVKAAAKLPSIDVRRLTTEQVRVLATLFEKLEGKAREVGGVDTQENLEKINPIVDEIDTQISTMIGLKRTQLDRMRSISNVLFERRISRAEKASPESVRGEEEPRIVPSRKLKKQEKALADKQLTRWIGKS